MRKKPEKAYVGLLNFAPEVVNSEKIRLPLMINDVTLREGQNSADVAFSTEVQEEFCSIMANMGVHQVQFRASTDSSIIKTIRKKFPNIKVDALVLAKSKNWKEQIKMAKDAGAQSLHITARGSEGMLRYNLKQTYEEMRDHLAECISFARDMKAEEVCFSASDCTRTDIHELIKTVNVAVRAGANVIALPDTVGVIRPQAYRWMISQVRNAISDEVLIAVHCHNDFGLALANSFAGLEAGAQIFDVSVNGLGERAGNTAIDEFLVGLWALYGIEIGIPLGELTRLSEWVAKVTGMSIPVTKPVSGRNAFAQKTDTHYEAVMDAPFLFEPYDPEIIGKKITLYYGVGSGLIVLKEKLQELCLDVPPSKLPELKQKLDRAVQEKKHSLSDDDIRTLVQNM